MIDIKTGTKAKKSGTAGGASAKTTYINGTISEADHAARADKAKRAETADQAEYAVKAGTAQTANYAIKAGELDEDAEVLEKYVRNDIDNPVHSIITFEKLQKMLQGLQLGSRGHGLDGNGNAQLADVILDRLHDPKSTPQERVIIGAQGFDMYLDENGKSHLYIDDLAVRNKLFASAMEIRQVSYAGGTTIFSNAGSTIAKVAHIFDAKGEKVIAYKCYAKADDGTTATANWWKPGMMGLCQTFNIKAGVYEGVQNRYYWRLCIGAGQEYLDDGKLYDYFTLSNLENFAGQDRVQPDSEPHILANELGELLQFDGVLVSIVSNNEYTSFADILTAEGITKDDGGADVKVRRFYGYDPESNAAPAVGDVVVNVGDQVRWNQYGNVIKLSTSTEDNASDVAPAISMYHGIGAPRRISSSQEGTSVWQWKEMTSFVSPLNVMYNAKYFRFVTYTDAGNMIDVGSVYDAYDLKGSYGCAVRATDGSYTPALDSITFSLTHRIGNYVEAASDFTLHGTIDGKSYVLANKKLSDLADHLADAKMVQLEAIVGDEVKARIDYPVMEDGAKGDKGEDGRDGDSIKGDPGVNAAQVNVIPSTIVFETNDEGEILDAPKSASVLVIQDGQLLPMSSVTIEATGNCEASVSGRTVVITSVNTISVKDKLIPCTSGSVRVMAVAGGKEYYVTIPFAVNLNSFFGDVYWNNKELSADFTNLKDDLKKDDPDILKVFGGSLRISAAQNMFSNYEGMVDENGKIIKTGESGLVTKADFAGLFATAFSEKQGVVSSDISAFITSDDAGKLISNARIEADHINLSGHTMAFTGKQITIDTGNFKLDASGNVSMTGKINATSGKIGVFMISPDGYKDSLMSGTWEDGNNPDVSRFTTRMQLSKNLFEMIYKSNPNLGDVVANEKFCRVSLSMGTTTDSLLNPVYIKAYSSGSQTAAIVIDSEGGHCPSYAIYARSGTFAGLRLNYYIGSDSYTINNHDHFILNTATNDNTVYTLPSPADSVGQVIFIANKYDYACVVKGSIYNRGYASAVTVGRYGMAIFISDGYHWIFKWFKW